MRRRGLAATLAVGALVASQAGVRLAAPSSASPARVTISASPAARPDMASSRTRRRPARRARPYIRIVHPARAPKPLRIGTTARVIRRLDVAERAVFITIDDGYHTDARVLRLIRKHNLPVTVFLTEDALRRKVPYYRAMARAGVRIQNHTRLHPFMNRLGFARQRSELCGPNRRYAKLFGRTPTMMRPPYGAYGAATLRAAARCRLGAAVLWNAEMRDGRLLRQTKHLRPGDIILLHFRPTLYAELSKLLRVLRAERLGVASLDEYLRFRRDAKRAPKPPPSHPHLR